MDKEYLGVDGKPPWWTEALRLCCRASRACDRMDEALPPVAPEVRWSFETFSYDVLRSRLESLGLSPEEIEEIKRHVTSMSPKDRARIAGEIEL